MGATASSHHAQCVLGVKVEMIFGQRPYVGTVVSWEAFPEFGRRIQHVVLFEDGTKGDYSWQRIMEGAEAFVKTRAAPGAPTGAPLLQGGGAPADAAPPPAAALPVDSVSLGVPASFRNYPFQSYLGTEWVEGRIVDREVLASGDHRWRLQLLAPRQHEVIWMDRTEFLKQLEMHKLKLSLNHPARKLPTVAPVRGLRQPVGDDWSTAHPLVGSQILTHLTTTTEDARQRRASLSVVGSKGKSVTTPTHTVFIEAARGSGPSVECWGRTQDDLDLSVLFIGADVITEGAFAHELPGRASKRGRGFANRLPTTEGRAPPLASASLFPDTSFDNPGFRAALRSLPTPFLGNSADFYRDGFRLAPNKIPRCVMGLYRRGLHYVVESLLQETDAQIVDALWRVFLLYDGLILGPFRKGAQFASVIKERVGLFLAGNWGVLFSDHLQFRDSARRAEDAVPFHSDPRDAKARRAEYNVITHQSLSSGASALRANPNPPPPVAGAVTGAFQKLNPQAGDPINRPREARTFIGPQTHDQHVASMAFLRSLGLGPSVATTVPGIDGDETDDGCSGPFIDDGCGVPAGQPWVAPGSGAAEADVGGDGPFVDGGLGGGGVSPQTAPWTRRPLDPPSGALPPPITFSVGEVMKRVRRTNKASAGGLSGSNYKSMQAWFSAEDSLAEKITSLFNLIAAGKVPSTIIPLLTAGRGVALPKASGVGLRPVVVGSIILRFVGTLALIQQSARITSHFLEPKPLQFAVGLAGGCELMISAITALLDIHPEWVDIAADAKNAFNSFCRTKMWGPLLEHFPNLAALGRLMYGEASSVIFHEDGVGRTEVKNSVGTRQGCSWGSFLYCLTIQPLLQRLADEFPDCVVLAFADDVHILGPPRRAAVAYERWKFLYEAILQGQMNDSKSKCFSPSLSEADVRAEGLPRPIEVTLAGTRVLGGQWVPWRSVEVSPRTLLTRSPRTLRLLGACPLYRRSTA